MCGIAGIIAKQEEPLGKAWAMLRAQAHRGPDGSGMLIDAALEHAPTEAFANRAGRTALCHNRLAVIDLSAQAAQPMADASGRYHIVYNGEIYNYLELRAELQQQGAVFRTASDTEVILAAYAAWGQACWAKMRGMWALVIWDRERDEFIFSRDRFGIKPLYIHAAPGRLHFASEIKAILAALPESPRLNRTAAVQFLDFGLLDHLPQTFWDNITPFPEASYAVVRRGEPVRASRYWELPQAEIAGSVEEYRDHLRAAIAEHLRSDVPVGFCLSGGLDSSSIVALARQAGGGAFNTYTAAYEGFALDERPWAREVAASVGATGHEIFPKPDALAGDLDDLLWHQEQPFGSFSLYAQWCVMRRIGETGIKVVLDGQGADESLCGYKKFYYFYLAQLFGQHKYGTMAAELFGLLRHGDRRLLCIPRHSRHLPAFLRKTAHPVICYREDVSAERAAFSLNFSASRSLRDWQALDLFKVSLPALLRYEDRNAMAFSVESRVPFLDHRLVEYGYALPDAMKLRGGRAKVVLREAVRGIVPDSVLARRTKVGFEVPPRLWLDGPMRERVTDGLTGDFRLSGLLDAKVAAEALPRFFAGDPGIYAEPLMRLFILNAWMRRFSLRA